MKLKKIVKVKICGVCGLKIKKGEEKQLHHIVYYVDGGLSEPENLCWLHSNCHIKLHRHDKNLFKRIKFRKNLQELKAKGII